jgi:TfoX/Sxy family transcriptional regulator of competence genes
MAYDDGLAGRVRTLLKRRNGIAEKHVFGGIGFLLNGNMCVGVWEDSLIVRFDKSEHDDVLKQEHVRPFDVSGRPMRGWALVASAGVETEAQLKQWVDLVTEHAESLPPQVT